jgi:adenylate kinase
MAHLVLIGLPGSGKGTQATKLIDEYGFSHVSTGNLLREEVAKATDLGKEIKSVMDSGDLVSDDLVIKLLKANINVESSSYIFDGFPRTGLQAQTLDEQILNGQQYYAVYFELNPEVVITRLSSRRMTKDGKYIYNLLTNPPKEEGICDVTGEELIQRKDDQEDVIKNRISVFFETVDPILEFYRSKNNLVTLDASKSLEEVYAEIRKLL